MARTILIIGTILCLIAGCSKKKENLLLVSTVIEGDFTESLTATGFLDAINSVDVLAPNFQGSSTLIYLITEGAFVNEGDKIAQFDSGTLADQLTSTEDKINNAKYDIDNTVATWNETIMSLSNSLSDRETAMKIQEFSQEALKFAPRVDQEKGKLDKLKAERDLYDTKSKIKMAVLNNDRVMRTKIDTLRRLEYDRGTLTTNISRCMVYAPKKGLVVYKTKNPWTKEKIKIGDTLRRDQIYLSIPDLERMQVKMEINEVDIHRVRNGLPVRITLDAFPDNAYTGRVSSVGALAHAKVNNTDIQVFDVVANVREVDVDRLRPGMSARVEITIAAYPDVSFIPLDAVFNKQDDKGTVFLLARGGLAKQEVILGPKNDDYVIIQSKLPEGAKLVLYDPVIEESGFRISQYSLKNYAPAKKRSTNAASALPVMPPIEEKAEKKRPAAITAPAAEAVAPPDTRAAAAESTNAAETAPQTNRKKGFSLEQIKQSKPEDYKKIEEYMKRNNLTEDAFKTNRTAMTKMMTELGLVRKRTTNAAPSGERPERGEAPQ